MTARTSLLDLCGERDGRAAKTILMLQHDDVGLWRGLQFEVQVAHSILLVSIGTLCLKVDEFDQLNTQV